MKHETWQYIACMNHIRLNIESEYENALSLWAPFKDEIMKCTVKMCIIACLTIIKYEIRILHFFCTKSICSELKTVSINKTHKNVSECQKANIE